MKRYHILGQSNSIISLVLENLYALYKNNVEAVIVKNVQSSDTLAYQINEIKVTEIFDDQWKPHPMDEYLFGVFRCTPKKSVYEYFLKNYDITDNRYASLIHPQTVIAHTVLLKQGLHIGPHVVIAPFAEIGNFVSINRQVSIGHHTKTGDFTTINPGCNIAGKCNIGNHVLIGMGANILDNIEIGDNAIVGAGSLVTKSVPPNTLVYGVPAKEIRQIS